MKGLTPLEHNLTLLEALEPSMRYTGGDYYDWQRAARQKLIELLGLPFVGCSPELEVEYINDTPLYRETRFNFQSEKGYRVPGHILRPAGASGSLPVVICLQGHSTGMYNSLGVSKHDGEEKAQLENDRQFALLAVEQGLCAVCIEQRCFGECGGSATPDNGMRTVPDCYRSSMTALLLGRTTVGERVWDVMRLIDLIETEFEGIDKDRIYIMGNSGGGTTSFYSACCDERIAACMPSCAFCTYLDSIGNKRHCSCNYIPGIARYFDMDELIGLIAPRPLVIVSGEKDEIFPRDGAERCFTRASELYSYAGAADKCKWVVGPQGHRFYSALAWPELLRLTGC